MKFLVAVLLLAACAAASASERKLRDDDASSETFFHGTAPKPSLDQIHNAIFGFNQESNGRKLMDDAKDETFWPFLHGTAPKPSISQIHHAIFGFNADGSKVMPEAMAPAPSAVAGRRLLQDPAHSETFFHGTAPKPTFSQIHQAIFGFNSDLAESAKAPAPATRKLLADGAHDETFWPFLHGTAPKPSISQIHHAIFGFNADGSKVMPEAMAPAPSAVAGRRLLQDPAHSETFFHGTAPKPTYSQIHQAIFGFNSQDDVAPKALSGKAPAPMH